MSQGYIFRKYKTHIEYGRISISRIAAGLAEIELISALPRLRTSQRRYLISHKVMLSYRGGWSGHCWEQGRTQSSGFSLGHGGCSVSLALQVLLLLLLLPFVHFFFFFPFPLNSSYSNSWVLSFFYGSPPHPIRAGVSMWHVVLVASWGGADSGAKLRQLFSSKSPWSHNDFSSIINIY